jgi:hypothetical protein
LFVFNSLRGNFPPRRRATGALLDDACCNFNDWPGKSLTIALQPDLKRPTPLGPVAGDETRIARLSTPAKKLSVLRGQDPRFVNGDKSLAGRGGAVPIAKVWL